MEVFVHHTSIVASVRCSFVDRPDTTLACLLQGFRALEHGRCFLRANAHVCAGQIVEYKQKVELGPDKAPRRKAYLLTGEALLFVQAEHCRRSERRGAGRDHTRGGAGQAFDFFHAIAG